MADSLTQFVAGSYRDRTARVLERDGRILRALSESATTEWRQLAECDRYQAFVERGDVVESRELGTEEFAALGLPGWAVSALEHGRVLFVCFLFVWLFGLLRVVVLLLLRFL